MILKSPIQLFIALAVLLACSVVAAQVYKWVDKDGKVQFTDTPPPPSAAKEDAKKINVKPANGSTPGTAPKKLADANKDFEKRRTEATTKSKKDDEKKADDEKNAEVCNDAKSNLAELQSGRPMGKVDAKGDRALMSDEDRAAQSAKMQDIISKACKG